MHPRQSARLLAVFVALLVPALVGAQRSGEGEEILEALGLHEGMTVCEIGAGDGSLTLAAARVVGPSGKVYSSELGEERLASLRREVEQSGLAQIQVVSGDPNKTNFQDGVCDGLFMRNVYHHFDDPAVMDASIYRALKSGGRLAIIDFKPRGHEAERPQDRDGGNGTHGVSAEAIERELKEAGFRPVSSGTRGEGFIVVFAKGAS